MSTRRGTGEPESILAVTPVAEVHMEQASIDRLAERVDCLERENRRLKRFGAAVVLGLLGVMIAGARKAAVPDIVEARQFRLVDEQGRGLITTYMSPDGRTVLGFFDRNANLRMALQLTRDGRGGLDVYSKDEKKIIGLGQGPDDNPSLRLSSSRGEALFEAPRP
jgi:hypothetical protein